VAYGNHKYPSSKSLSRLKKAWSRIVIGATPSWWMQDSSHSSPMHTLHCLGWLT
jgi:hypothetical protein